MTEHSSHDVRVQREKRLLGAKLGEHWNWKKPDIVKSIGPYIPSVFEEHDQERCEIIAACDEELRQYTDAQIAILVDRRSDDPHGIRTDWENFLHEELRRLGNAPPPWYAAGFGHPDYAADFDYWSKMPKFSLEEVLCLSVGVEPEHFSKRYLKSLQDGERNRFWRPLQFLLKRYEQLKRKFDPANHDWSVAPANFLQWTRQVSFDAHPEFLRLLSLYHEKAEGSEERPGNPARPDQREIDKIAQLFTAMAIDNLGYNPSAQRSPIPKEIAELAASMGIKVSEDTVRKYLKRGASFLPEDWKPD